MQADLCRYYHERGNSADSKPFFELAEQICRSTLAVVDVSENDRRDAEQYLSEIHYSHGAIATETNEPFACMIHYSAFLELRLKVSRLSNGLEDIRLAIAHNEMGIAYMLNKGYAKAADYFNRAIKMYRGLPDFSQEMIALAETNLGLAFWLLADLDRADDILSKTLQVRKDLYGPDDQESFKYVSTI